MGSSSITTTDTRPEVVPWVFLDYHVLDMAGNPKYDLTFVGRGRMYVCEDFAAWFQDRFPLGCWLDEVYAAVDVVGWLAYFLQNANLFTSPNCAFLEVYDLADTAFNDANWFNETVDPDLCAQVRLAVPLEVVLDAMPVQPGVW